MNRSSASKQHHKIWEDNVKTLKKPNNKPSISNGDFGETNIADNLIDEYKQINETLKNQGLRKDHTLLLRLNTIMMDLGLYLPSPP